MNTFQGALSRGAFTVTAELIHAARANPADAIRWAGELADHTDGIQLAENSQSDAATSTTALAALLLREGIDATPTLTCRDRNRIALQSELLGLKAIGVSSLVLNRGSTLAANRTEFASNVFDIDGRELIAMAHEIDESQWMPGTDACVPLDNSRWDAAPLLDRALAGARFLRLQPCLDLGLLRNHMARLVDDKVTWHFSVIVSIAPLPAAETAGWLLENIPGAVVPDNLVNRLESSSDPEREGVEICAEMIREVSAIPGVSGINLVCQDDPSAVIASLQSAGLRPER